MVRRSDPPLRRQGEAHRVVLVSQAHGVLEVKERALAAIDHENWIIIYLLLNNNEACPEQNLR